MAIALFAGMREGEIADLSFEDIKHRDNVDCFDITEVKSEAGVCLVPVHTLLKKLGSLEYVRAIKSGALFTALSVDIPGRQKMLLSLLTGNDLYGRCKAPNACEAGQCLRYIEGVIDHLETGRAYGHLPECLHADIRGSSMKKHSSILRPTIESEIVELHPLAE